MRVFLLFLLLFRAYRVASFVGSYAANGTLLTNPWTTYTTSSGLSTSYNPLASYYMVGNGDKEIEFWHQFGIGEGGGRPTAISIYSAQEIVTTYPDYRVKIVNKTPDTMTSVRVCLHTEPCPMILSPRSPHVAARDALGEILSLDSFLSQFALEEGYTLTDDFLPNSFYAYNSGFSWKAIPLVSEIRVLMFNVTTLELLDVPLPPPYSNTTWSWHNLTEFAVDIARRTGESSILLTGDENHEQIISVLQSREYGAFLYTLDDATSDVKTNAMNIGDGMLESMRIIHRLLDSNALAPFCNVTMTDPDVIKWLGEGLDLSPLRVQPPFKGNKLSGDVHAFRFTPGDEVEQIRALSGSRASDLAIAFLPDPLGFYGARGLSITKNSNPAYHEVAWRYIVTMLDYANDYAVAFGSPPPFFSLLDAWKYDSNCSSIDSYVMREQMTKSVTFNFPYLGFTEIEDFTTYKPMRYTWLEMQYKNATPEVATQRANLIIDNIFRVPKSCHVQQTWILLTSIVGAFIIFLSAYVRIGYKSTIQNHKKTRMPSSVTYSFVQDVDSLDDVILGDGSDVSAHIQYEKVIGTGHLSTVYAGTWAGKDIAMKVIPKKDGLPDNEVQILKNIPPNQFTVPFLGVIVGVSDILLASKFMSKGNLRDYVVENASTWSRKKQFMLEAASAVCFLHRLNIIHGDIALRNFLLDENGRVKVSDFGMSHLRGHHVTLSQDVHGPIPWSAPETITDNILSTKSDVYSYGMTLVELIQNGLPPWGAEKSRADIIAKVVRGYRPIVGLDEETDGIRKLLYSTWDAKPSRRPTMTTVVDYLLRYSSTS
jgi:predicted Ser/Thr protein kinase